MRLYRDVAPAMLLASVLALAILVGLLGCRDDTESPTAPEPGPALATTATQALSFRQVSAGHSHTCGVASDNRAYCWGDNFYGQLGDGTTTQRSTPVAVAGGHTFVQVSAGYVYTCGVATDNRAYCWGNNQFGKLGDGTEINHSTPVAVAGAHRFRQVDTGVYHTCGVTTGSVAYCWGYDRSGQLGDNATYLRRLRPVPVVGGLLFQRVTAGDAHSCGLATNGRAYCWGQNVHGQLGDGTTSRRLTPVAVAGGLTFIQVVAGTIDRYSTSHTCGIATDNRGYCWGGNDEGQLGDGTTIQRLKPRAVAGGLQFKGLIPGGDHTCGVTTGNRAYCWGYDYYGELGDGSPMGGLAPTRLSPFAVVGGFSFKAVTTGGNHTCALTTGNLAYCWGQNNAGQLGDGTTTNTSTPVAVSGPI